MGKFKKGHIPWIKGKKMDDYPDKNKGGNQKGYIPWNTGLTTGELSEEHKLKIGNGVLNSKTYKNNRHKIAKSGKNNPAWKGGGNTYWKTLALKRDDYTCVTCGLKETKIMIVDHIIPKKIRPDLKLVLDNLQTLCPNCHARKTIIDRRNIAKYKRNNK